MGKRATNRVVETETFFCAPLLLLVESSVRQATQLDPFQFSYERKWTGLDWSEVK